jgi:branched-chain amino acid transport system ATP-binding protein
MLALDHVTVSFGGLLAVADVSFEIPAGKIIGLIGPNGAGKTTAFNVMAGRISPTSGRVLLQDKDITGLHAYERSALGLARTFQIPHEFARLTVLENFMAAADTSQGESIFNAILHRSAFRAQEHAALDRALAMAAFLDLRQVQNEMAGNLSGGQKKLLELGRALMRDPKLVLLDEIGAGINRSLLARLADKIAQLNAERGLTFCLIEHDLDYVARLCSHVIVMAQGEVLMRGSVSEVRNDARVIEAYFGGGRYENCA